MQTLTLDRYIEITPGVCGGKPRIAGRRITVQDIVIWHEHLGMSADEINNAYDVSLAEIYAALAYYYDRRSEIDKTIEQGEAFVREYFSHNPSRLDRLLHGTQDQILH